MNKSFWKKFFISLVVIVGVGLVLGLMNYDKDSKQLIIGKDQTPATTEVTTTA